MVTAFVRVDLPDRSPDFQRIALEPGVPLLDRGNSTARLLRVWLGRFVAEPEWLDAQTVQFHLNDEQGRRIAATDVRPVSRQDLEGILRGEVQALRDKFSSVQPRGRTEQTAFNIIRERFEQLLRQPDQACADGALFRYRDAKRQWRLVWCWGYQRSESKAVPPTICPKSECRRLYLVRKADDAHCPKCQTPMPVYRFPWRKVALVTACLLLISAVGGWRYWSTLPRSSIDGQVVWSGFSVPVAAADIRIEALGVATRSDEDGRFRLERLPAGTWEVSVEASGFRRWQTTQVLLQSQPSSLPVELVGEGVLTGRVVDFVSRNPVSEARIQFAGTSETITTDEQGQFRREGCRRGPLTLDVIANGYPPVQRELSLADANDTAIEFELTGDAILVGRVISAAQEQPLPGVTVMLERSGQTTRTDAEGWYVFKQAPAGRQTILVEADGFATEQKEKVLVSREERQAPFTLAGAAKVSGTVVRAVDSSPMSGVEVRVAGTKFAVKTNDEGYFQLRGVTAGKATIEVTAPGFAAESLEQILSDTEETTLPFKLRGDTVVAGQVTDEVTRQPVAEVEVRLLGSPYQTRTGIDGKFRLDAVPSLPAKLEARASGYVARTTDIRPVPKEPTNAPLMLLGNASVTGLVVERWSEEPVAGAKIMLAKTELSLTTSDEGTFEIKGLRGGVRHELQFVAEGLAAHTEVVETKLAAAASARVVLSGAAQQSGRVVSATDESPLVGAQVLLAGTKHQVLTDNKGRFVLDKLRTGRAVFEVSATGFKTRRIGEAVSPESKPLAILLGGDASVAGQVLDAATRQPIADAEVTIAKTVLKAKTDAEGRFNIEGAFAGATTLTAQAVGYPASSEEAELVAERETEADITLAGTASVSGEIFDDVGKPVANAIVRLGASDHKVATGPRGEFTLPQLRGGPAQLQVSAPMFANKTISADLKSGEVKPLGRVMLLSSLTLRGRVVHALTEEPLPNAKISIASPAHKTEANAQGEFQLEGLPAKPLTVRIESPGFVTEQLVVNPAGDDERGLFCLCPQPKADEVLIVLTWHGAVKDLNAHLHRSSGGRAEAHVHEGQPQSDNLAAVRLNQNGRGPETLRIHPLKEGRYEFAVQALPDDAEAKAAPADTRRLSMSEATVRVYRFGQSEARTYRVGRHKRATVWQPFALEIIRPDQIVDHVYKAEHYRLSLPPEIGAK